MRRRLTGVMVAESGVGTVLAVGLVAAAALLISAIAVPLQLLVTQAQLQAAVDSAAIDGSHALRGLISGYPCDRVKEVLHINMDINGTCLIVGEEVRVVAHKNVAGIVLTARGWAGP